MQLIRMERAKCAEIERAGCALAHAGGRTVSRSPEQIQIWGAFSPTRHDQTSSHHFHLVSPEFLLTAARAPPKLASHLSRSRARQLIKMLHSPEFKPTLKESMVWKHLGRSHACLYPLLQNTVTQLLTFLKARIGGLQVVKARGWSGWGCWTWLSVSHVMVHKARTMQSAGGSAARGQGGHRYQGN